MSAPAVHVSVRQGPGIVARTGTGLMVMMEGGTEAVREELLTAFGEACESSDTPGRKMARRLVGLMSQAEPEDVPSFGACAPGENNWAVILHQGVVLHVIEGEQTTMLSGMQASTWVDRIVENGFDSLTLVPTGQEVGTIDTRFRFDGGVIPGGGASIVPANTAEPVRSQSSAVPAPPSAPAPPPPEPEALSPPPEALSPPPDPGPKEAGPPPAAPQGQPHFGTPTPTDNPAQQAGPESTPLPPAAPTSQEEEPETLIQRPDRSIDPPAVETQSAPEAMPEEDVPFESVPLLDISEDVLREPLPVLTEDTPKDEIEDSDAPLVYGVLSPSGYFNHPDALFCAVTGVGMVHRTHVLVQRPRPPLGVVVADDGSTFTLDSNYVVGREPERDPSVEQDEARPLKLQDAERSLSRVHAELRLVDWDVFAVDRGSANGTYVLPRGAGQWKRLVADTPEKIVPGTRIAFGKRVVTYESHHQINQQASP